MSPQTKKFVIIGGIVFIFILLLLSIFFAAKKKQSLQNTSGSGETSSIEPTANPKQPKVWQILLDYYTDTGKVSLNKITVKNGTVIPPTTDDSAFHAIVMGRNNTVLFETPIQISGQTVYLLGTYNGPTPTKAPPRIQKVSTSLVTIPYFTDGTEIIITYNDKFMTSFVPPKE